MTPTLKIVHRRGDHLSTYSATDTSYPEFVFQPIDSPFYGTTGGGGRIYAMGLDESGKVRCIVYRPPEYYDHDEAQLLARLRLKAEVPEIDEVKFAPFYRGTHWHKLLADIMLRPIHARWPLRGMN